MPRVSQQAGVGAGQSTCLPSPSLQPHAVMFLPGEDRTAVTISPNRERDSVELRATQPLLGGGGSPAAGTKGCLGPNGDDPFYPLARGQQSAWLWGARAAWQLAEGRGGGWTGEGPPLGSKRRNGKFRVSMSKPFRFRVSCRGQGQRTADLLGAPRTAGRSSGLLSSGQSPLRSSLWGTACLSGGCSAMQCPADCDRLEHRPLLPTELQRVSLPPCHPPN